MKLEFIWPDFKRELSTRELASDARVGDVFILKSRNNHLDKWCLLGHTEKEKRMVWQRFASAWRVFWE